MPDFGMLASGVSSLHGITRWLSALGDHGARALLWRDVEARK
jgi:hypothetical protein